MSVKHALLALLELGPASTYQLRKEFDQVTGETWPLNIGQVSTTMSRLERDGFVTRLEQQWELTNEGRQELNAWWSTPQVRTQLERDELVIKLALAVALPGVDAAQIIQNQRSASQTALHQVTKALRSVPESELAVRLVLHNHIYRIESELRWLNHAEGELSRNQQRSLTRNPAPEAVKS